MNRLRDWLTKTHTPFAGHPKVAASRKGDAVCTH